MVLRRRALRALSGSVIVAALLAASPSGAMTPEEIGCLKNIALTASRSAARLIKVRSKCEVSKALGHFPSSVDCLAQPLPLGTGTGSFPVDNQLRRILMNYRGGVEARCAGIQNPFDIGVQNICDQTPQSWSDVANCAAHLGELASQSFTNIYIPVGKDVLPESERQCRLGVGDKLRVALQSQVR